MSELTNALNRILSWFKKNKPSTIESLQPGLTIEEIDEKVKDLPFRLTQEVYELYQWRNGMIDDGSCFFQAFRFFSLEEAIEHSRTVMEDIRLLFPFDWFPIFEFEGDYSAAIVRRLVLYAVILYRVRPINQQLPGDVGKVKIMSRSKH